MSLARLSISIPDWDSRWLISSFGLQQAYNDHHVFQLSALVPDPPKSKPAITPDSLFKIVGQTARISIEREDGVGGICQFEGFVDRVVPTWSSRVCTLQVTGYSKSIQMDCGPRFRVFSHCEISEVAQKIVGNYKLPLSIHNAKGTVEFSVQSQETDYSYLCRLAEMYDNMFFFDGIQMHFGSLEYDKSTKTTLVYGKDIKQVSLSLDMAPLDLRLSGYQLENSTILFQRGGVFSHTDKLASSMGQRSLATYPPNTMYMSNLVNGQNELKTKIAQLLTRQAYDLVRLSSVSNFPGLKIGSKINISKSEEAFAYSEYVVIEISHSVNNDRSYSNSFIAVPSGYPFPPRMQNSRAVICGPLLAIVKDHKDPHNLGRIKVQFIGDEEKSLSPWLRVLTPYTGFGGMYFMPEKEDQVVVFSEDFNIEKSPFVLPAFYHGKSSAGQWYDPDNKKKGFSTEKTTFKIDDRSGKLYIEADEIEIKARNKMTLDGGKAMHQAAEVFEQEAENEMNFTSGNHLTLEGKRIDINP